MNGAFGRAMQQKWEEGIREGKREGIREGKREGIREGIREGKREGEKKIRIASLKMLEKGFDYEMIAEILRVSVEQVKEWEEESRSS